MRQMISGLVVAIAVVGASAAPASACGLFQSSCGEAYVAPVYSGCNTGCGGGWAHERLPDPEQQYYTEAPHQYYYVNQGPTYGGPGDFAPYPAYREGAVSDHYRYHSHFHPWHAHTGYWGHPGMRYGYEHRGYEHRGYAHPSMRYGYHGMPHQYGYREHTRSHY